MISGKREAGCLTPDAGLGGEGDWLLPHPSEEMVQNASIQQRLTVLQWPFYSWADFIQNIIHHSAFSLRPCLTAWNF